MANVTNSSVVGAVAPFFQRKMLLRAVPRLLFSQVIMRRSLTKRNGTTMIFRKYPGLAVALAPLLEGVPGQGQYMSKADRSVTLQQWGDFVSLTDFGMYTIENDILREASDLLGEQSGQTLDLLIRDIASAGTAVFYGGAVAARVNLTGVAQKVDGSILDRVIRYLDTNNARRFKEMVKASTNVSTFPIRDAFIAMCHPELRFTIQSIPGFISLEKYASKDERLLGEFGAYNDIRFCVSTHGKMLRGGGGTASGDVKSTSGNADVGIINIFAEQALGGVPLEKASLENFTKPTGSAGSADPLNQIATQGWKHTGARLILDDAFMARIECTVANNAA